MVSHVAAGAASVSGWTTLRRAAIGAGLALAASLVVAALGHPVISFWDVTLIVWSTGALHSNADHRHGRALTTAALSATVVWLGITALLDATGLPTTGAPANLARAVLGILAASQSYALITRTGQADCRP
ncbi:hypothetical protein ACWT_5269 [Actinoplanes sp. SE50]|uniref:hypothetical protein n=1 Tax=unclassified Actinoplanes TaxID=2626549 RepID=UPI00023EBDBB|nr:MULTISPECIES: hypothetical protein [unclassified Actinoplanes]AEV86287.1 hypothetical protein ACPL_5400 [Actinoplanes sp. SE50/110]ATO84684.1 hypothetical protein ACWT_5269 [Actinoplanes sp. SE50]SLM02094.1 hypothetical protein ACSP50_5332 [Actinoplanes sp. SE50/110]